MSQSQSEWELQSYKVKGFHGVIKDISLSQNLKEERLEEIRIPRTDQDLRWRKKISMAVLGRER